MSTMFDQLLRRRHPRHSMPRLGVRLEGRKHLTYDWSLGGFRICGFHRAIERFERVAGDLRGPGGTTGPFHAEVAWQNGDDVGFRLLDVDSCVFAEMMEHSSR